MVTGWQWRIVGSALWFFLLSMGFAGVITAEKAPFTPQATVTARQWSAPAGESIPAGREAVVDPWARHIRRMDEALAQTNVDAAKLAWHDAYIEALRSRPWEGMVAVGDAYLRIGTLTEGRQAAEAKARQAYLAALFRARNAGSVEGVLRTAQAFSGLGEREVVDQSLRIADGLVAHNPDEQARGPVREFREQLGTRLLAPVGP